MARIETISYPLNDHHTDGGELQFVAADPAGDIPNYNGILLGADDLYVALLVPKGVIS